jgi:sec-independent protein translocase protein TatC
MDRDEKKPLMGHLEELRKRLIACAVAVGVCFAVTYGFSEKLFTVLAHPLKAHLPEGDRLIFTNLPEMFFVYIKTALVSALLLAAPFIFYQVWMFVAPGLYRNEKRYVFPFVFFSTVLFVGGALFGYFIVFPFGFRFFLGFANEYIQALPSVKQYFSLSIKLLLGFGLIFELPDRGLFPGPHGRHLRRASAKAAKVCHPAPLRGFRHPDPAGCDHPAHDGRALVGPI